MLLAATPTLAPIVIGPLAVIVLVYHIIHNLFFHSLRRFPGPRLWAATRIPWCYYQYTGQLPQQILELHKKYGHTVRIAPNELSYTHESAWKTIYGQRKAEMGKDPVFRLHTPTGAQNILVADRETHSRQRRLLSHAFSESALREQEPILQTYATKLVDQLKRRATSSTTAGVDMVSWYTFSTFDLIGHMSFGENFSCLDKGEPAPFVSSISAMAMELVFIQMWKYWNILPLRRYFTPKHVEGQRKRNIGLAMQAVQRRIENGSEHRDFLHYILAANDEKGMSPAEINVNAFSLNIAGSESTATALSAATFLILRHRHVYDRLVGEIRSAYDSDGEITLMSTVEHNYLDAVISEALRLFPPVAITMPRTVPSGGETIAHEYIVEGTGVGVPFYAMFRHPDNFHRPDEFLPQRWLDDDSPCFANDRKDVFQPFSFGPRGCLGKNIARAEMRLLFAKLLFNFDLQLVDGQDDWMGQKVFGFWQKKPLMCRLTLAKT